MVNSFTILKKKIKLFVTSSYFTIFQLRSCHAKKNPINHEQIYSLSNFLLFEYQIFNNKVVVKLLN